MYFSTSIHKNYVQFDCRTHLNIYINSVLNFYSFWVWTLHKIYLRICEHEYSLKIGTIEYFLFFTTWAVKSEVLLFNRASLRLLNRIYFIKRTLLLCLCILHVWHSYYREENEMSANPKKYDSDERIADHCIWFISVDYVICSFNCINKHDHKNSRRRCVFYHDTRIGKYSRKSDEVEFLPLSYFNFYPTIAEADTY